MAEAPRAAWMYAGGLENEPDLIERLAAVRPLLGNRGEVLRRVRDPWALRRVVLSSGFSLPEIRRSPAGLPSDGSWVVKQFRSCGGQGVSVYDSANSAPLIMYFLGRSRIFNDVSRAILAAASRGDAPWCGLRGRPGRGNAFRGDTAIMRPSLAKGLPLWLRRFDRSDAAGRGNFRGNKAVGKHAC